MPAIAILSAALLGAADTDVKQLSQQEMWGLIGLAIMGLIYLGVVRPMLRKKKDPLERGPAFASLSQQRSVERQMQNLLVELSEMARQITSQLDTRAAKLDTLIKQADERIAMLQSGTARTADSPQPPISSSPHPPSTIATAPDPRHAEVYALADQGGNASDIATRLNRPRGEIELILALRSR